MSNRSSPHDAIVAQGGAQTPMTKLLLPFLLVICGLREASAAQTEITYEPYLFTTLAGAPGVGATDGTGSAARFFFPQSVAVDGAGNIYVADTYNSAIRKITPAGVVSTFVGLSGTPGASDGIGTAARFDFPYGIAVDNAGNVYVADTSSSTIRKITPAKVVTTVAGFPNVNGSADGIGSAARFHYPFGIAVDNAGNIYVADSYNDTIRKITPARMVTTFAGQAGVGGSADGLGSAARFSFPTGMAVDGGGNIYVADGGGSTIRKISPAGMVSTLAGTFALFGFADGTGRDARFNGAADVTVDSAGNLYVADYGSNTIRKVTSAGVVTTLAGFHGSSGSADGTGSNARFKSPQGVAISSTGNLYVADTKNNTIRKVTSAAVVSTFAGAIGGPGIADGPAGAAQFNFPLGVAVDSARNVFVADSFSHTIRKISSGVVSTLAGLAGVYGNTDGIGSDARFYRPTGIAADKAGNLYVGDYGNVTIRKITPDGVVSTLAGLAGSGGNADGIGSAARFYLPAGVAVDNAGNVYVAEYGNHTIRKITSAGVVSTLAGLALHIGSTDGAGAAARFSYPQGVTVDDAGIVYVADTGNSTIRKITPDGVVTTLAGLAGNIGDIDGTGSAARFTFPAGVAVDGGGNVCVADTYNHAIRKITPDGVVTTAAGLRYFNHPTNGYTDGIGKAVGFYYPQGIAADSTGIVYVADQTNCSIRVGAQPVQPLAAVSRKMHGNAGTFDIDLPLINKPGIECRSGGVNSDYTIVLNFMNAVSIESASFVAGAGVGSINNFSVADNHATINLTGVSNVQTIVVILNGVNDGIKTGYASIPMNILVGDTTSSLQVNSSDISQIKAQSGQAVNLLNFREDILRTV